MSMMRTTVLIAITLVLLAYTYTLRYRDATPPAPPSLETVPRQIDAYASTEAILEPESLGLLGADATIFRTYTNAEGNIIWLFLGYFAAQQENSQIHSPKHCYPGSGWNITTERTARMQIAGVERTVKELEILSGPERRIVFYWFSSPAGIIGGEFALKWYQMKRSLLGKVQSASFVRISTRVAPGREIEPARRELIAFIERISPSIERVLHGSGSAGMKD